MIRNVRFAVCLLLIATLVPGAWILASPLSKPSEEADRVREAATVLSEIMEAPDNAIPLAIASKAEAVAVFPSVVKGGFVVGAQWGRGVLSVRDRARGSWSPPAFLTIAGGTFGAQIGGEAIDLVLVIMNRRGLEQFIRNEFKIGADASAAAGPVGRGVEASTDILMRAQILSYSRSRGLFAGATVGGASVHADRDANLRFYGSGFRTKEIVLDARSGAPDPVETLRDALLRYF